MSSAGGASPPLADAMASACAPPRSASAEAPRGRAPGRGCGGREVEDEAGGSAGRTAPAAQPGPPQGRRSGRGPRRSCTERPREQLAEERRRRQQLAEVLARLAAGPPGLQRQASAGRERLGSVMAGCVGEPSSLAVRLGEEERRGWAMAGCVGEPCSLAVRLVEEDTAMGPGFDAVGIEPADPTVVRERPERFWVKAITVGASKEETRLKDIENNEKQQAIEDDLVVIKSKLEDLTLEESLEEYGLLANDWLDDHGQAGATIVRDVRSSLARATATLHWPTPVVGASPTESMTSRVVAETSSDLGPTWGSALHSDGTCRPCLFAERGCKNGDSCPFCHICAPSEKKRASEKKGKQFSWRCLRKATVSRRGRDRASH